jgi:hypothetical protein
MFGKMKSSSDWIVVGLLFALVLYLINECNKKSSENMDSRYFQYLAEEGATTDPSHLSPVIYDSVDMKPQNEIKTKCGNFVSSDLLPKNNGVVKDDQFQFAPNKDVKLLIKPTQSLIGVNTQGGSLRNPNLDIRSSPAIEKKDVSPWLNSTIGPDLYRRPLE